MYPHIKKNKLITIIACLSLLSILLSACGLGKQSNRPIFICGSHDEDGNGDIELSEQGRIFAIDVDGEQISVKQISEPQYYYSAVKVSPTGEQIAYYSMRDDANNDDGDIVENKKSLILMMDLPGVKKEDVRVKLENNVLEVEGRIDYSPYEKLNPVYTEYNIGHYARKFTVSNTVDTSNIEAVLNDGVLSLTLLKAPEAKAREIPVK